MSIVPKRRQSQLLSNIKYNRLFDNLTPREKWYQDFKSFIRYSNSVWVKRYPKFRANYQGDKIIGYQIAQDHVKIPKQYTILANINKLTPAILQDLDSFVIKASLGHQGNKVFCFASQGADSPGIYRNLLKAQSPGLNIKEVVTYVKQNISRKEKHTKPSKIIIEEYIGDPNKGIPIDWKVYVTKGTARVINIYLRTPQGKYMACFDRNWNRIPLKHFYVNPKKIGYIDLPDSINLDMPDELVLTELIVTAEKLASVHGVPFCRYDFYCEQGQIYLGEITPVCGGVKKNQLTIRALKLLFPVSIRKNFLKQRK